VTLLSIDFQEVSDFAFLQPTKKRLINTLLTTFLAIFGGNVQKVINNFF